MSDSPPGSTEPTAGPQEKRLHVLVAHSDASQRRSVRRILSESGMRVTEAGDSLSAFEQLGPDIDAVVLDFDLSDEGGIDVCRRIKANFDKRLPVILISADPVALVDHVVILEGGADAYLHLPIEPRELVATVISLGMAVDVPMNSEAYRKLPIGETQAAEFSRAVEEFSRWLRLALEQRSNKVDRGIPGGLRKLAHRLTQMRVGPRDVIEIYSAALKQATDATTGRKDRAAVEEGRLLVLELMGNLVSNYRALSLASPAGRVEHQYDDPRQEIERDG